jgi:dihydrofolate reductase
VIGGATLYEYFMQRAEWLYLTEIKKTYEWDTFFPDWEEHFEEVERLPHGEFDFVTYRKRWIN